MRASQRRDALACGLPLTALSKTRPFPLPEDLRTSLGPRLEASWQSLQDDLARLLPGARHVIARRSGHYIQLAQPQLVVDAILRLVRVVRRRG